MEEALSYPILWPNHDALLDALDAWFDETPTPRALLVGPGGHGRSALLSRWVLSASERKRAEVVYLPVRRKFGTALDRDVLGFLYARLEPPSHRVQGPAEMRVAIANRLEGGRESDEAPLVLVLDGVEEAIGFRFDSSLLGKIGEGVRVIVAIDGDPDDWLSRLGWSAQPATILSLPPLVEAEKSGFLVSDCPVDWPGSDAFRRVMALLSRALGPIGRVDLVRLLQIGGSPRMDAAPPAPEARSIDAAVLSRTLDTARDIVVEHEGAYAFSDDRVRRQIEAWLPSELLCEVDMRYVKDGREVLSALRERRIAPGDVSSYVLEYYRAHLCAGIAELHDVMELCTPEWLWAWATRPHAFGGFLSDIEAARARAAQRAAAAEDGVGRAQLLADQVRCALVETSLATLAKPLPSARPDEDEDADTQEEETAESAEAKAPIVPLGEEAIDFARGIDDGAERASALATLATSLSAAARDEVLDWAYEAARSGRSSGRALVTVAVAATPPRREAIAREAAEALTDSAEDLHFAVDLIPLLPSDRGNALLQNVFRRGLELPDGARWLVHRLADLPDALIPSVWAWATALPNPTRSMALARSAPRLPPASRASGLETAVGGLLSSFAASGALDVARAFAELVPRLPEPLFSRVLGAAEAAAVVQVLQTSASEALIPFAEQLAARGRVTEALAVAHGLPLESERFQALAKLLPRLSRAEQRSVAAHLRAWLESASLGERAAHLEQSASGLVSGLGAPMAVGLARSTGSMRALVAVAEQLGAPDREVLTAELVEAARWTPENESEKLLVLPRLAGDMSAQDATYVFSRLLAYLSVNTRKSLLIYWNGDDFRLLVPLLLRSGGEAALLGTARAIVDIGAWLP